MFKDYCVHLDDISESLLKITGYINYMDYKTFSSDDKTVDAVLYNLEKISLISSEIPDKIRYIASDVKWELIESLQSIFTESLNTINKKFVWEAVTTLIPALSKNIITLQKWSQELNVRHGHGLGIITGDQEYERGY